MATKTTVITTVTSDLSGAEDAATHTFALDGASYELDLTDAEWEKLNKALEKFVGVARKTSTRGKAKASKSASGPTAAEVKEWARANGYEVSDRGRVPGNIREAYDAAN